MRTKDFDKLERIKSAMISLILKEGINGASVGKIAKAAGVSPATIYVYYENKDEMLAEVFSEYAHQSYHYMSRRLSADMSGAELIESLIRSTYAFALEHEEVFSFVEQCSSCPTIQESVCQSDCCTDIFSLIHAYQDRGIIRNCSDNTLVALLFAPVKYLAMNRRYSDGDEDLGELIRLLQNSLLY